MSGSPSSRKITPWLTRARDADTVLVSLFVRTRSGQGKIEVPEAARNALAQILALGKPIVTVSFGSPYLLRDFPDLEHDDIRACLTYAANLAGHPVVVAAAPRVRAAPAAPSAANKTIRL